MKNFKLSPSFKRYLAIGVLVFGFEIGIIIVAGGLGASNVLAVSISFILGLFFSFVLQKFITFGDNRTQYSILLPQAAAFSLLVVFNFIFTILITHLTSDFLPATVSRSVALSITTVWNFYLYRTKIFYSRKDLSDGN